MSRVDTLHLEVSYYISLSITNTQKQATLLAIALLIYKQITLLVALPIYSKGRYLLPRSILLYQSFSNRYPKAGDFTSYYLANIYRQVTLLAALPIYIENRYLVPRSILLYQLFNNQYTKAGNSTSYSFVDIQASDPASGSTYLFREQIPCAQRYLIISVIQ